MSQSVSEDSDRFGFTWGNVEVTRMAILPEDRRVLSIKTPRQTLKIYVTRTGLIRVFDRQHELKKATS